MHPYAKPLWNVWRFLAGQKRAVPTLFNDADVLLEALAAWRERGAWFHVELVRKGPVG